MDKRNVDIVLVRMDKIGDLIVSLPVDQHPAFGGQRVHWFITSGLSFITEQASPKRQTTEFKRRFSPFEFLKMVRWFRRQNPQVVVMLHNPWWVSLAAWWADVPERIGRRSQWHSVFHNLHVIQKRSSADRHESDFNFDLVEWGFNRLGQRRTSQLAALKKTYLNMLAPNPHGTLESRGLKARGFRVMHPGMAGSALNWPQDSYVELGLRLSAELPLLITGTKSDRKYLTDLERLKDAPGVRWLVDELKQSELLDLLSQARSVIAPSTGVLHLAASLGTPVVGIYSPRKVEHPRRWGPKGAHTAFLVPPVSDGDMFSADVMRQITTSQVYQTIQDVERAHARPGPDAHSAL